MYPELKTGVTSVGEYGNKIKIDVPKEYVDCIKAVKIKNSFTPNKYRMCFIFSVLVMLAMIILCKDILRKRIELFFVVSGFLIGVSLILQAQHRLHGMKKHILRPYMKMPTEI